jgi:hypothetical protein
MRDLTQRSERSRPAGAILPRWSRENGPGARQEAIRFEIEMQEKGTGGRPRRAALPTACGEEGGGCGREPFSARYTPYTSVDKISGRSNFIKDIKSNHYYFFIYIYIYIHIHKN